MAVKPHILIHGLKKSSKPIQNRAPNWWEFSILLQNEFLSKIQEVKSEEFEILVPSVTKSWAIDTQKAVKMMRSVWSKIGNGTLSLFFVSFLVLTWGNKLFCRDAPIFQKKVRFRSKKQEEKFPWNSKLFVPCATEKKCVIKTQI